MRSLTRRRALQLLAGTAAAVGELGSPQTLPAQNTVAAAGEAAGDLAQGKPPTDALREFAYSAVTVNDAGAAAQRANVTSTLMALDEDSLLKPFLGMAGKPAPGATLGGWYEWNPDYDFHHDQPGFAPAHCFGQWMSAMARLSATAGPGPEKDALRQRAQQLRARLAEAISPGYFAQTRFPAYSYDKLVCGLMDMHRLAGDPEAFATLDRVTQAAGPSLPGRAVDREVQYRMGKDLSWMWDESYTMPENLYLVSTMGAGDRYAAMADAYLNDATFFEPLARGDDMMCDRHAYSYVNSLCSAMQAYLVRGSAMHLQAAVNGFHQLQAQSYATGGWGPDELLRKQGYDELKDTLTSSHRGFETPCGSYAHCKLTRYLLRATRDGIYGDSMERVVLNTVRGALPLEPDGSAFYYSDYNTAGERKYFDHKWPCCAGTLPQVVADYGLNSYLWAPGAVWINLYEPSELRWAEQGVTLRQSGDFLNDGSVRVTLAEAKPAEFAMHLRIPAWGANGATLAVNGQPHPIASVKGFTMVRRVWHAGDTVDLRLPMKLRLEPLPANGGPEHPGTVALLYGPRVLFPLREAGDRDAPAASAAALLAARRVVPGEWRIQTSGGERSLAPFTEIGLRAYSTYFELT
jgi:DUF1680 family protein